MEDQSTKQPTDTDVTNTLNTSTEPLSDDPIQQSASMPEQNSADITQQVIETQPAGVQPQTTNIAKKSKSKWLIPGIIAGSLFFLGASAYGYKGVYTQLPVNVWKQAITTSGAGLAQFLGKPTAKYSAAKVNGTVKVVSPTTVDATIAGSFTSKKAIATVDVTALGQKANLEVRSLYAANATNPDMYIKLSGLKNAAALLGANNEIGSLLKQVDGQWYVIDNSLTGGLTSQLPTASASLDQIQSDAADIVAKVGVVLQDKLFTVNQSKAVVVVKKNVGKEVFKGRKSQKYVAQVRKAQLKDMTVALKDALKTTKANEWLSGTSKQTFEQATNFDALLKEIDSIPEDKLTAEVWVDLGLKYIRNIRIAMPNAANGTTQTIDATFDYAGGNTLPITLTFTTKDDKNDNTVELGMTLHKEAAKTDLRIAANGMFDSQKIDLTAVLVAESTNDDINVPKPENAQNIMQLLGGLLGGTTSTTQPTDLLKSFSL